MRFSYIRRGSLAAALFLLTAALFAGCGEANSAPSAAAAPNSQAGTAAPANSSPTAESPAAGAAGAARIPGTAGAPGTAESSADREANLAAFSEICGRAEKLFSRPDPLMIHAELGWPGLPLNTDREPFPGHFPDFSSQALRDTLAEYRTLLNDLSAVDSALLSSEDRLRYAMLKDSLETALRMEGLELYYNPLAPGTGIPCRLPAYLASLPLESRTDVERYLSLLSGADELIVQAEDFAKEQANAGLAPSDTSLSRAMDSISGLRLGAGDSLLAESFERRLEAVTGLSEEEKQAYREKNLDILRQETVPAYKDLYAVIREIKGHGKNDGGLSGFPQGKDYYSALAFAVTGSSRDPEALSANLEELLSRENLALSTLLENNPGLSDGSLETSLPEKPAEKVLEGLEKEFSFLSAAGSKAPEAEDRPRMKAQETESAAQPDDKPLFLEIPETLRSAFPGPVLVPGPQAVLWLPADASPNDLYGAAAADIYPGKYLLLRNQDALPDLRRYLLSEGMAAGWALFGETMAWTGNTELPKASGRYLARSRTSLAALYALMDLRINYDGWTLASVSAYLQENYGISDLAVIQEICRSAIDNPGLALRRYGGYAEIAGMQELAKKNLGTRYSDREFAGFLLGLSGASFRVAEPYFHAWMLAK